MKILGKTKKYRTSGQQAPGAKWADGDRKRTTWGEIVAKKIGKEPVTSEWGVRWAKKATGGWRELVSCEATARRGKAGAVASQPS